jgi:methionyl-tRNA formyltransferase
MRILFVIDETSFYHPHFLSKFLRNTTDDVVGAALVTQIPNKNNIELYLMRHWYYLRMSEIAMLAYKKHSAKILDLLGQSINGKFYSVKSVLKNFSVDYFEARKDINKDIYLEKIRSKKPEVIVSSNSLIFGEELLGMPSICCINRHCALLPSYGGLWPVFQAFRNGEKFTGTSINVMEKEIDKGAVLSFRKVQIEEGATLACLYEKCFDLSSDALIEALDRIKHGNLESHDEGRVASYYSFPQREHWKQFREKGGRFI